MAWKRLIPSVLTMLLVVLGFNWFVGRLAENSVRRKLFNHIDQQPDANCIALGNSLMVAGLDTKAFEKAWDGPPGAAKVVNLALDATEPPEHNVIIRLSLEHRGKFKCLIYGFLDDTPTQRPIGGWSGLVGNRAVAYYWPDIAAHYYVPGSRVKRWWFRLLGKIPMISERNLFWREVELLRRDFGQMGLPRVAVTQFGTVDAFASMDENEVSSITNRVAATLREKRLLSLPILDTISLAHAPDHEARVYFVEMPLPQRHHDMYEQNPILKQYREYLAELLRQQGVVYVPASDWILDPGEYQDMRHLTKHGAAEFSARLAKFISDDQNHAAVGKP